MINQQGVSIIVSNGKPAENMIAKLAVIRFSILINFIILIKTDLFYERAQLENISHFYIFSSAFIEIF